MRWLLESCRSAQKMPAHLYLSYFQKLEREAPQTQLLAVSLSELADPLSEDLGAMCWGYQSGETHYAGENASNWCKVFGYL